MFISPLKIQLNHESYAKKYWANGIQRSVNLQFLPKTPDKIRPVSWLTLSSMSLWKDLI